MWFNDTDEKMPRVILLVDFWHPNLSEEEKVKMSPLPSKIEQYDQQGFHDISLSNV